MLPLKKCFLVINILCVALILVYLTTYIDRVVPEAACFRSHSSISKRIHGYFGQTYQRYLVYLCNDESQCGEWTDRLQGITMAYLFSKLTKRKFGVLSTSPVRLEKLIEPVLVDWTFNEDMVVHGSCAVYDLISEPSFFDDELKTIDLDDKFTEDVVYIRIKKFTWSAVLSNPRYEDQVRHIGETTAKGFFELTHDILRLNQRMLYQFIVYKNQFKPTTSDKLVCAVVDGENGHLTKSDTLALWKFLDQFKADDNTKIVVSSLDGVLLDTAIIRYTDRFMSIPGLISQFDSLNDLRYRILDNMRQIILDYNTLLNCDSLVISCGNPLGLVVAFTQLNGHNVYYLRDSHVKLTDLDILSRDFERNECSGTPP